MLRNDYATTAHSRNTADPLELRKFVGGRPPKLADGGGHADMLRMSYTACKVTTGAVHKSTVTPGPNSSTHRSMSSTAARRGRGAWCHTGRAGGWLDGLELCHPGGYFPAENPSYPLPSALGRSKA